jgi:hypothetical protein
MPRKLSAIPKRKAAKVKDSATESGPDLSHITPGLHALAVPIGEVFFDPANARLHSEKNLDAIRGSLAAYKQVKPIVVRRADNVVIAGNGTLSAALSMGFSHIAAVFVDLSHAASAGLAIADNRTSDLSEFDKDALDKLLREVSTNGEAKLDAMLAELASEVGIVPAEPGRDTEGDPEADCLQLDDLGNAEAEFLAPFPWFGGKSRVARFVWSVFGDVKNYVEPFFGSGAVLLHRPWPAEGVETVNDFDGLVANFWRAVQAQPDEVAKWADWPVNENDLHARHLWLVERKDSLQAKLEGDPDYFDAKIAGWWCWGMACWIGGGFCSGQGPWQIEEAEDGTRQLVHLGSAGQGVKRQLVHLGDAGRGVQRKLVHLGDAGQGVQRKLVHEGDEAGRPGRGECGLVAWMQALSERLQRVRVCCGDWSRVCGGKDGDSLGWINNCGTPAAIFLDPPYADTADRDGNIYRVDSESVAHAVREWAIAHGDDERLRIVLAGYEGEHDMPPSWRKVAWKAQGGMENQGQAEATNCYKERLWLSPHCLPVEDSERAAVA